MNNFSVNSYSSFDISAIFFSRFECVILCQYVENNFSQRILQIAHKGSACGLAQCLMQATRAGSHLGAGSTSHRGEV